MVLIPDPQYSFSEDSKVVEVAILQREKDGNKQVRLYFGNKEVTLVKEVSSNEPNVLIDGKPIDVSQKQDPTKPGTPAPPRQSDDDNYINVYELPDKTIQVESEKYKIGVVYDGKRFEIRVSKMEKNERKTDNIRN